jgi:glycosyltransferase involved in cell wall biosynthesis
MRIGIDARELAGTPTGVGRYLAGLLREWTVDDRARAHAFTLYAPGAPGITLDARLFTTRLLPGSRGTWWEQIVLPRAAREDHLDVFFAPAYTAPVRLLTPTVVTIHDVSFIAHPHWFRLRERLRRRVVTRRTARRASSVITVSEFSRREIVERLRLPESRVRVIRSGIDPPVVFENLRTEPRVLYVGSIFNRRHVPDLIRAFIALSRLHPEASLDLVGDNRTHPHEDIAALVAGAGAAARVTWHRYASEDTLRGLYSRARAFAFLSEYEGLGLTPLEALTAGIPPVVFDTEVARESCGDAALFVPRGDHDATVRALETALFDDAARARLRAAAPAALAPYNWPRAARETLTILEEAVREIRN